MLLNFTINNLRLKQPQIFNCYLITHARQIRHWKPKKDVSLSKKKESSVTQPAAYSQVHEILEPIIKK